MKNYCTLGDSRYLPHLICLIDSMLSNFNHAYRIHVLGMDDKTTSFLKKKYKEKINIHHLSDVEKNFDIKAIKHLPAGQEAISNAASSNKDPQFVQFCWAMAPCFSNYIMSMYEEDVTYVDADILFYRDMDQFFEELDSSSIGFVRHRIDYIYTSGEYNVGIVHFKCNGSGRSALNFWCSVMKDPQNPYCLGYGTCGDQKYLEAIKSIYNKEVCIVDKKFGHLAPWNVSFHNYNNSKIIWNKIEQDLTYFHFAHFVLQEDGYKASYKNEWIWGDPVNYNSFITSLYEDYSKKMRIACKEIS